MTLCVKKIDNRIPIYELVFFRSLFSLLITSLIINKRNLNPWGENKPLLVLRGLLRNNSISLYILCYKKYAFKYFYCYSIYISYFYIYFCRIFINEKITKNIIIASIIGWLGILIILNPSQLSNLNIEIRKIIYINSISWDPYQLL